MAGDDGGARSDAWAASYHPSVGPGKGGGGGGGGGSGGGSGGGGSVGAQHIFTALLHLRRLCNHPLLALAHQPELRKQAG